MKLTIGMAAHDDFHGVYFTVQSLRMYHAKEMADCEIVVVDNNPGSADGKMTKSFCESVGARYVPYTEKTGTSAPRDHVFRIARGDAVMCVDSHVLIWPGAIKKLLSYYDAHPTCNDLLSGPMMYDNLQQMSTHFKDEWRAEMWGTWDTDPRGLDVNGIPFEIPAQGLGLFTCRRKAWLGFNEHFRGFGGEEFYIHEKYRQAGARNLCLPFLRWGHRFGRPAGATYPITRWNKIRNYVLGHVENGMSLDRVKEHFVDSGLMPVSEWESLVADPTREMPEGVVKPCCNGDAPKTPATITLEHIYEKAVTVTSDINEHCQKLREIASQCDHVVEFGMRHGVSTVALLAGQPKKLTSYDLKNDPIAKVLKDREGTCVFEFKQGNSLSSEIELCDLLFIDTKHTSEQLYAELTRHESKARRWIAMHDTQIFGEKGEDGTPGLLIALERFMRERPEWSVVYHVANNHGFTVISRLDSDKPSRPGLIEMGVNFSKALAAHVLDGGKNVSAESVEARINVCMMCPFRKDETCTVCGCDLLVKTKWNSAYCPIGRWKSGEFTVRELPVSDILSPTAA